MRFDGKNVQRILHEALVRHGNPPKTDVDAAVDRAWENLQPDMAITPEWKLASEQPSRRFSLALRLATITAAALIVLSLVILREKGNRAYAVVETSDSEIVRVSRTGTEPLKKGARVAIGDVVQATGSGSSVLALTDGSRIELRSQTEFWTERSNDGIRIHLQRGLIIVNAAKQPAGRLYVQTKDVTVSVVGTVFLVNAEEEGSRVAVIEGEVRVQQGETTKNLKPGDQLSTNPTMEPLQVRDELSWSRNVKTHVALLQQAAPAQAPPRKLEFDVATIRPAPFKEIGRDLKCRGIDGVWSAVSNPGAADAEAVPQGRCTGIIELRSLLRVAFGVTGRRIVSNIPEDQQIFETYQIEGKAEDARTATKAQLREMAQNYVIDRFKLMAHRETKEEDGYALRIAEGGVKFKETFEAEQNPFGTGLRMQPPCYWCLKGNFSLNNLADLLEYFIIRDKPVINATGLDGIYDITLMLRRIEPIRDGIPPERGASSNGVPIEFSPSLAESLENQLGLRLERGKISIDRIVLDHIERPPEN
jgi:uncharacterized protein (TIGR03435 family)